MPARTVTTSFSGRLRVALGATTLAVVALVAPAAAPIAGAQAAPGTLVVIDHNIEKRPSVLARAVDEARARNADVMTLQEVCATDAATLASQHPGWTSHFMTSRPGGCGGNNDVGTLLVWRGGSTARDDDYALTADPGRTPHLSCLTFGSAPVRHVCSVHLVATNGATIRPQQTHDIKALTRDWIQDNHLVVVGGDFNAVPDDPAMDNMFARGAGNTGRFVSAHELEGRAQSTTDNGRHIDYVFISENRAASGSLQVVPTGSDHHLLAATLRYS